MKDSDDFFRGLCALASIGLAITATFLPDPVPWLLGAILVYMWGREN